jgi:hypothetical protein
VERIVDAANTAPTHENCQPFRFHWDGARLEVTLDAARARHSLDFDGCASRVGLGGVLEALDTASTVEGFEAETALSVAGPVASLRATVRFTASRGGPHELASALRLRASDRRFFRGGSLAHPVFAAVQRDSERERFRGLGLRVRFIDRFPSELVDYLARTDGYVWKTPEVYRDVIRWARFTRDDVERTRDGYPWKSMLPQLPEVPVLRLTQTALAAQLVSRLGMHHASRLFNARQVEASAALACYTVRVPGPEALVEAGRLIFSTWVRLNHAGYGVHPLGLHGLQLYAHARGGLAPDTRPEFLELFRRGREAVSRAFGLAPDELPVWILRTGVSPPLPPEARTLRLPVHRLLTFAD